MPGNRGFTSKAQQGFMYVHHPDIAQRMAAETPSFKRLPEQVEEDDQQKPYGGLARYLASKKGGTT